VGPGVATRLNVPLLSCAIQIEAFDPTARTAIVHRRIEQGIEVLETTLPALLTVEKEIAAVGRAPLPNLIRAARYQPEIWSADAPVLFDAGQIGIKGSPTIVGKAFTPSPKDPGEMVHVTEAGLAAAVSTALARIAAASVVQGLPLPADANGGSS